MGDPLILAGIASEPVTGMQNRIGLGSGSAPRTASGGRDDPASGKEGSRL